MRWPQFSSGNLDASPARPPSALRLTDAASSSGNSVTRLIFPPGSSKHYEAMAGVPGFEPGLTVLETAVLAADTIPLHEKGIVRAPSQSVFGRRVRERNPIPLT